MKFCIKLECPDNYTDTIIAAWLACYNGLHSEVGQYCWPQCIPLHRAQCISCSLSTELSGMTSSTSITLGVPVPTVTIADIRLAFLNEHIPDGILGHVLKTCIDQLAGIFIHP